jgi:hypothetical protein
MGGNGSEGLGDHVYACLGRRRGSCHDMYMWYQRKCETTVCAAHVGSLFCVPPSSAVVPDPALESAIFT